MHMKIRKRPALWLSIMALLCALTSPGHAQDWSALAQRIVGETAGIREGHVVLISGGKHTLPLMEQIAAEVHRKGAHPLMLVESDVALKAFFGEKPESRLAETFQPLIDLYGSVDFEIALPGSENGNLVRGIAPARLARVLEGRNTLNQALEGARVSLIGVGLPNPANAAALGLDPEVAERMHWAAVNTDYRVIARTAERISELLRGARRVTITTREGTDLSFSMGDRPVFVDDGILTEEERVSAQAAARFAALPGGFLDIAPVETSINGTIVIPHGYCLGQPIRDVRLRVVNGVAQEMERSLGSDCYARKLASGTGPKHTLSVISLGLNPEQRVVQNETTNYYDRIAAGFIELLFGGDNRQLGGTVSATSGIHLPLVGATVTIDGHVVVREGQLVP
jgi:aminopeptidase